MASKASKAGATRAVFIGLSRITETVLSDSFTDTISASRAPYLGKRTGTADEWRAHCKAVFEVAETEETAVILAATRALMADPASMTVFCKAESFGATDSAGKVSAYPTIATPDAWREFGSLARSLGATVRFI